MNASDSVEFASEDDMVVWIEGVLADFRDGKAQTADVVKLQSLLLNNATARRIYLEANELSLLLETVSDQTCLSDELSQKQSTTPSKPYRPMLWWAAAAVMFAGIVWLFGSWESEPLATLSASHEPAFSGSAVRGPSEFGRGMLSLTAGIAQLELSNGVQIMLEENCTLELIDESTVQLSHGKIRVRCPLEARGFEVLAPGNNRIVDLGTEFGVSVKASGELDLHVFDGFVELFASENHKRTIEAGAAVGLSPLKRLVDREADDELFATIETLRQKRWAAHHRAMLERDDLLLYYDFAEAGKLASVMEPNRAGGDADGEISGASRVAGRVSGKGGLLFDRPGDCLNLELDSSKPLKDFTIAMWIKVDRLKHRHSTLLNSNGWDIGDIHFQIKQNGNLRFEIHGLPAFQTASATVTPGAWQFVSVSWDFETESARFFHNGMHYHNINNAKGHHPSKAQPTFGSCQIGAWGEPAARHNPTRDFKGRIDEVMIFSKSLEDSEIKALYESSKP
ncbi:LamG domain-containing protein [bacterium]|nr:LamG domain-containing protein [bacterium]